MKGKRITLLGNLAESQPFEYGDRVALHAETLQGETVVQYRVAAVRTLERGGRPEHQVVLEEQPVIISGEAVWVTVRRGGDTQPVFHVEEKCCVGRGTPLRIPTTQPAAVAAGLGACSRCAGGFRGGE